MVYRKDLFNARTEYTSRRGVRDVWGKHSGKKTGGNGVNGIHNIVRESENSGKTT